MNHEEAARRTAGVSRGLEERGWDGFIAGPSPNFFYFTGLSLWRSERLIAAVFRPDEEPVIVCPAFEAERVRSQGPPWEVRAWEETEDPYQICAGLLPGSKTLGIEEKTPFSEFHRLRTVLPGTNFVSAEPLTCSLRRRKSTAETDAVRRACRATIARIAEVGELLTPGMTELEAFDLLDHRGLVQFGPTGAVPHASPGENRLSEQDAVVIDTFDLQAGYTSDITRTLFIGEPSEEMVKVWHIVKNAQDAAIRTARAGIPACGLDRAARQVIEDAGYGPNFTHRVGHGLGLEIHEPPYLHGDNEDLLLAGDVVTIEPGIYLSGRFGVRIEDDVLITEDGCEVLSERVGELGGV